MSKYLLVVVVLFVAVLSVGCTDGDNSNVVPCTPVAGMDNGGCQSTQPVAASTPVVVKVVPVVKATTVAPIEIAATVVAVDLKGMAACGTNAKCLACTGQGGQWDSKSNTCSLVEFCKTHVSASQCP